MRAGNSENVVMAISGHKTASVFRRYDIPDEADLRTAVAKQEEFLEKKNRSDKHNLSTIEDFPTKKELAR